MIKERLPSQQPRLARLGCRVGDLDVVGIDEDGESLLIHAGTILAGGRFAAQTVFLDDGDMIAELATDPFALDPATLHTWRAWTPGRFPAIEDLVIDRDERDPLEMRKSGPPSTKHGMAYSQWLIPAGVNGHDETLVRLYDIEAGTVSPSWVDEDILKQRAAGRLAEILAADGAPPEFLELVMGGELKVDERWAPATADEIAEITEAVNGEKVIWLNVLDELPPLRPFKPDTDFVECWTDPAGEGGL